MVYLQQVNIAIITADALATGRKHKRMNSAYCLDTLREGRSKWGPKSHEDPTNLIWEMFKCEEKRFTAIFAII